MWVNNTASIRSLVLVSIVLTFMVIGLGAYTRLTDAGLGCPDWPGCYGQLNVPSSAEQINQAERAYPNKLFEPEKAWNEMVHRYFAGTLGLLVLAIAVMSFLRRHQGAPIKLPFFILLVVTFQAALGMWTVTLKLMPIVVMAHLLGGFTTLALLFLLYLRLKKFRVPSGDPRLKKFTSLASIGILVLLGQIMLGGWTSSNYAALVCTDLPICQDGWPSVITFDHAFTVIPPVKETYEFGHLDAASRVTIHVMHRIGAIITAIYLFWLAFGVYQLARSNYFRQVSMMMVAVLAAQLFLGVSNIYFSLPISVAVAHNLGAACLLLTLVLLRYSLKWKI